MHLLSGWNVVGGRGYSGKFLLGMCRWLLRALTPLLSILWPIMDPILVTFGQLSHFQFLWIDPFFMLNEEHFTFHLLYKHFGTFANRKWDELSYPPKNPKMCDPILVTLWKMRPHYSQSSRENATPSSGRSPLASYKEVALPLPGCFPVWPRTETVYSKRFLRLLNSWYLNAVDDTRNLTPSSFFDLL